MNFLQKLALAAALLVLVTACSKDTLAVDLPSASTTENFAAFGLDKEIVTLDVEGNTQVIFLNGASNCSVVGAMSTFFSVQAEKTSVAGQYEITVKATRNKTGSGRSAKVALTDGSAVAWLTINQNG